jgi:hypothetical protein
MFKFVTYKQKYCMLQISVKEGLSSLSYLQAGVLEISGLHFKYFKQEYSLHKTHVYWKKCKIFNLQNFIL